jgi:3-oxosteroid 1-dehydrogenase
MQMQTAIPERWHAESDLIVIGSGIGGLAAAITAREFGAQALVLERSDLVGGITAYSFGEMWVAGNHLARARGIEDSTELGAAYVHRLGAGFADEARVRNQAVHGSVALKFFEERAGLRMRVIDGFSDYFWPQFSSGLSEGRFLEPVPFAAKTLGEWRERTRTSPHVPYGLTHHDMFAAGGVANFLNWNFAVMGERLENDERCLGPGLAAYFVKAALDHGIALHTETTAERLITDAGGTVIGVVARRDGSDVFFKARRGVVIAASGYDGNIYFEQNLSQQLDVHSLIGPEVDGAHLKLAGRVGAQIARVPDISMLGYAIPGEELGDRPLWRNALTEMGLPHALVVNQRGRRFGDESFYRTLAFAVDYFDGATQTQPNFPCWIIQDSRSRAKYPFGSVMPGQTFPANFAIEAASLRDLAEKAGIDALGLTAEVTRFNGFCSQGADADFQRGERPWSRTMCGDANSKPNPNLGSIAEPPFYAVRLERVSGGGISAAGLVADLHCRVLDYDQQPIRGLYVAGNSMARLDMGAGIQSGLSNARGMVHGYLIGRYAAGNPSELVAAA